MSIAMMVSPRSPEVQASERSRSEDRKGAQIRVPDSAEPLPPLALLQVGGNEFHVIRFTHCERGAPPEEDGKDVTVPFFEIVTGPLPFDDALIGLQEERRR